MMNFQAVPIINETNFVPKFTVPPQIPQKNQKRASNTGKAAVSSKNGLRPGSTNIKPQTTKKENFASNHDNFLDFSHLLMDLSFDKSESSFEGCSYLGMLEELMSSSSEEKPIPKKNQRTSRVNLSQAKTNQLVSRKKATESVGIERYSEKNKENIQRNSNLTAKPKPEEKPKIQKSSFLSTKRGRKSSPEKSEKSTQSKIVFIFQRVSFLWN